MKDLVLLLVLLHTLTFKTSSLPNVADANHNCPSAHKYIHDDSKLCCSKCPPGHKLKKECTEHSDTVCEPCGPDQFMESWNFAKNCISCIKCKESKDLLYAQTCSSTTRAKCVCVPGKYCLMLIKDNCQECAPYNSCRVGYGVSVPGTATSNVQCKKCPEGTFSDTVSSTDACKPHSTCNQRDVIRNGSTTSDTVCKPAASTQPNAHLETKPATVASSSEPSPPLRATVMLSKSFPLQPTNSTIPLSLLKSTTDEPNLTTTPIPDSGSDKQLAAVICGVTGIFLLIIVIVLTFLCKRVSKKETLENCTKVDANGNCESDSDNTNLCYPRDTQSLSSKAVQLEQQRLLENGEVNQNQCISSTDGYNSSPSIGPLLSTFPLHQPHSAFSEPMPLQSNTDHAVSQIGATTQSSSQPNSPQNITPSPLVNVNINLHIGNGTCGSPAVMLKDVIPAEPKIPFGEEEESCSLLQQEDGKPSLLSVEENGSFSGISLKTLEQYV